MAAAKTAKRKTTVRTSVTVSESDYREIERIAERKKVSVAWVMRDAVQQYLTREFPMFRGDET